MDSPFFTRTASNFQSYIKQPDYTSFLEAPPDTDSFSLDLPYEKLSIFAKRYEDCQPLVSIPLFATVEVGQVPKSKGIGRPGPLEKPSKSTIPLNPPRFVADLHHGLSRRASTGGAASMPSKWEWWSLTERGTPKVRALTHSAAPPDEPVVNVPLGMVVTDHCGYASFDLGFLKTNDLVQALHREEVVRTRRYYSASDGDDGLRSTIGIKRIWIFPFGDTQLVTDALINADIGPTYMILRLDLDQDTLESRSISKSPWMPAMQNPGILDYKMSPGSFTLGSPGLLDGGGDAACETLTPSNLSPQTFRFRQIARLRGLSTQAGDTTGSPAKDALEYKLGYAFEYRSEWYPIGHSLGNLSYSLPLAPGEIVKLAVVDWDRGDTSSRQEVTRLSESLQHEALRDRSLTESVSTMLDEWQRGGSVLGGIAGAGAGAGIGAGAGAGGGVAAIGGAFTTTAGTRNLTADTTQRIADAFHQATTGVRELRSTIVVQSKQQETSNVQTRTVSNYNHGHALTILYYEVLRHYRMVTRLTQSQPVLFLDYSSRKHDFADVKFLLAHRRALENCLLDERLREGFDAIARIQASDRAKQKDKSRRPPDPPINGNTEIIYLSITITTGTIWGAGTDGLVYVNLVFIDNKTCTTAQIESSDRPKEKQYLGHRGVDAFERDSVAIFTIRAVLDDGEQVFPWKKLRGFVIGLKTGGLHPPWFIEHVKLEGVTPHGAKIQLYDAKYAQWHGGGLTPEFLIKSPPPPTENPLESGRFSGSTPELLAKDLLVEHLIQHSYYYDKCLWLGEDSDTTVAWLEARKINSISVLDRVREMPVGVSGNWVAFPLLEVDDLARKIRQEQQRGYSASYVEQLVSLPTRGLFAEAKLGHCNANEIIDNTRFWKWHEAPIPHQAPDITGIDAGSRYQAPTATNPTPFPQSLVNIVSPQPLPDPTGLAEALKVTGIPDIFRDSSGLQSVATLLKTLSQNAASLTSQALGTTKLDGLVKSIQESDGLDAAQKKDLTYSAYKAAISGSQSTAEKPGLIPSPAPSGGSTGGEAGAPTPSPDKPNSPQVPSQPLPSPGRDNVPVPTPKSPPSEDKPKKSKPLQAETLLFQFNFNHGFRSTFVEGDVTIDIIPSPGAKLTASSGYKPGVRQTEMNAESTNGPIVNGSFYFRTTGINRPGTLRLGVSYQMDEFSRSGIIGRAFEPTSAAPRFESGPGYRYWYFQRAYELPSAGNRIIFKVTPRIKEVTIKAKAKAELEAQLGVKVPPWAQIIGVDLSGLAKVDGEIEAEHEYRVAWYDGDIEVVSLLPPDP